MEIDDDKVSKRVSTGSLQNINERQDETATLTGLSTGLTDLDIALDGLYSGQIYVVAGRPSMGKSTLGLQFFTHNALEGHCSLYVPLEMPVQSMLMRMYASITEIPLSILQTAHLSPEQWRRIRKVMRHIGQAPLYLEDMPDLSMADLRKGIQEFQHKQDLQLAIIDYCNYLAVRQGRFEIF